MTQAPTTAADVAESLRERDLEAARRIMTDPDQMRGAHEVLDRLAGPFVASQNSQNPPEAAC